MIRLLQKFLALAPKTLRLKFYLCFVLQAVAAFSEIVSIVLITDVFAGFLATDNSANSVTSDMLSLSDWGLASEGLAILAIAVTAFLRFWALRFSSFVAVDLSLAVSKSVVEGFFQEDKRAEQNFSREFFLDLFSMKAKSLMHGLILPIYNVSMAVLLLLFVAIPAVWLAPKTMIPALVVVVAGYGLMVLTFRGWQRTLAHDLAALSRTLLEKLSELFELRRHIFLYGAKGRYIENLLGFDRAGKAAEVNAKIAASLPRSLVEPIALISLVFLIWCAHQGFVAIDLQELALCGLVALRVFSPIQTAYSGYSTFLTSRASIELMAENTAIWVPCEHDNNAGSGLSVAGSKFPTITIKAFWASTDVEFTISDGTWIRLGGESGAGKSTFIDAMLGFNEYGDVVFLDVASGRRLDPKVFWRECAYVRQGEPLLATTVRDYLNHFKSNGDSELEEVLGDVGFIESGVLTWAGSRSSLLDIEIGGSGFQLSGGQLQRLNIARALLQNKKILFLDEATANLDADSEISLLRRLKSEYKGMSVLFVSHRNYERLNDLFDLELRIIRPVRR